MVTKRSCIGLVMLTSCAFALSCLQLIAGPAYVRAAVSVGEVCISLAYMGEEGVLQIVGYSIRDKECQLALSSTERMGVLIEVAAEEINFSLKFLEEGEIWPQAEALGEEYTVKSRFEFPGWVVVVVQRTEQGGETG